MLFVAAGVALAGWLGLLAVMAIRTRPRLDPPLPETMDLGAEPPAVASYLVHGWRLGPDSIAATLLDLAGRNLIDIEQVAEQKYVVRLRPAESAGSALAPYEQRVLRHLQDRCRDGVVPAAALDLGAGNQANSWTSAFNKEVVADARARGLSRARWSPAMTTTILGWALAPAAIFGLAMHQVPRKPGEDSPIWAATAIGWGALAYLFYRLRSERDTAAGRAAASRWLGVRAYLAEDPAFPGMSPAAEAIWDRYLAYAAAFGLAATAVRALPIHAEDPQAAWSAYGGSWRSVKLRWPGGFWRPGAGMPPVAAAVIGAVCTLVGGALAWRLGPLLDGKALPDLREHVVLNGWEPITVIGTVLLVSFNLLVGVLLIRGVLLLARALPDLLGRTEVVGEVLRVRSISSDDTTIWYVVIDDGRSAELDVWKVSDAIAAAAHEGRTMRATVAPRLGHVYTIAPVGPAR